MGNALSRAGGWVKNLLSPDEEEPKKRTKSEDLLWEPEKREEKRVAIPQTKADLVALMKKLPEDVLSSYERHCFSSVMTFEKKKVSAIMMPKAELTFVGAEDYLGPLTLDKLHKTGQIHFLVRGAAGKIAGALHIRDLLNLKIKESDKAKNYLDKNLCYVREDYTLEQALAAFLRTGALLAVVVDRETKLVGVLLLEDLVVYLLGREAVDEFEDDYNIDAVSQRS